MKFSESVSAKCRYGEIANGIWGDWNLLWEDAEDDYQGHASFLVEKNHKYCFYEWWYGSCSGCDEWEAAGLSDSDVEEEMRNTALWMSSKKALKNWLLMLEGNAPISGRDPHKNFVAGIDVLSGGLRERINAVRKALDLPPIEDSLEEE